MDQFSHDLTIALEQTSQLDCARVSRWGRRRTRSTGNLPCAPQPTEDSSSSPTDVAHPSHANTNDGLDTSAHVVLPSDSDDKEEIRLPCKTLNAATRLGALESDSLNEAFSPARFFKPNARRKRKFKRMSIEYEGMTPQSELLEPSLPTNTGTVRKRILKPDTSTRSNLFFCGKRKRSNRDRYHDNDRAILHSSSMPRHYYLDEYRMRPRSFSSTSKPHSDRLLPLNKGLLSKIEKISQLQKTDSVTAAESVCTEPAEQQNAKDMNTSPLQQKELPFQERRKKSGRSIGRRLQLQKLQYIDQHSMDCGELNDFLSSSSISSSESEDANTANGTDREGDDELTDWPGNEGGGNLTDGKYDLKRKLTKKSNLPLIKSEEVSNTIVEDDTLMFDNAEWATLEAQDPIELRFQPSSEPINISNNRFSLNCDKNDTNYEVSIPFKQIESEMSGETSNPFLSSPPCQPNEVREIRAGCRRLKGERPGFSIKTSVNERLARFLQDPRQVQIRLPDIEIYEHDSLINLATLYSLHMSLDKGCAVLTKTSNTTQSVNIDQQGLQSRLFASDFKRRCFDSKGSILPRK